MSKALWRVRDVKTGRATRVIGGQINAEKCAKERSRQIDGVAVAECRMSDGPWRAWQKFDKGTEIF